MAQTRGVLRETHPQTKQIGPIMSYTGTPQNNMYRRGNAPGGPSPPGGAQQTYGAATPTYPQQNGTYPNSPVPPPRQNDGTNSSNGGGYALPPHSSPPSHSYTSSQQQEDNSKNKTPRKRMSIDARVQTKQWVAKNYSNLVLYFGLIVGVVFFYHLMSDGDFSFLLVRFLCVVLVLLFCCWCLWCCLVWWCCRRVWCFFLCLFFFFFSSRRRVLLSFFVVVPVNFSFNLFLTFLEIVH